jgi:hypothetical protein
MSLPWFKNTYLSSVTGPLTDDEMKDIPYPVVELGLHVTQRTAEVSGVACAANIART